GGPAPIYLLVKASGTSATPQGRDRRDYRRHWTPLHLDWIVKDLAVALARAVAAGARVERPPETHAWGRIALLAEPFGHGFCL
ncbi:VOC family protein, partial [Stenotrophomonas sp. SrG]|uniref:VOC family protein n=1 Tax=Stenotrophomonas sp. SrG TaxID=3414430 RepID=UPI003CF758C1